MTAVIAAMASGIWVVAALFLIDPPASATEMLLIAIWIAITCPGLAKR